MKRTFFLALAAGLMAAALTGCGNNVARADHATLLDEFPKDYEEVAPGQKYEKIFYFLNDGETPWHGRSLRRMTPAGNKPDCPEMTPIPDTEPGQTCEVRVSMAAPNHVTETWEVMFKQIDGDGVIMMPRTPKGVWSLQKVVEKPSKPIDQPAPIGRPPRK